MYQDFLSLGMKATELRIGNLVYRIQRVTEIHMPVELPMCIEKISRFDVDFIFYKENPAQVPNHAQARIGDICGIPLTEEWFWKAGFLKESTLIVDIGWLFDKPDFGSFYKEQDYWLPKPYYFGDSFGPNFKLKYVHQLQNLYFALTGEELQIERYKV